MLQGPSFQRFERHTFAKVVVHGQSEKILGVHILGANASEMIHEAVMAMRAHLTAHELADACHAHPTLSEAIKEAALAAMGRAIHV